VEKPINLKEHFDAAAYRPPGWREGYFSNQYHNQLRYGFAPAAGTEKKGTVVMTHGYGEFIELYYQAIQEYQKMGFDVWMMDFYGFGKSGRDDPKNPHRPSAKGMLRHVRDLDFFVNNVVERVPGKPLVMSGHSMGGHIGLLYLERHKSVFDAAIMSSPMFDIYRLGMPIIARPFIRMMFNIASKIGLRDKVVPASPALWSKLNGLGNIVADVPMNSLRETFNQMMRLTLPEARVDRPTFGWISATFNTVVRSMRSDALKKVDIPVLIGSAGIETLVDVSAHERAARLMPKATLVKLPTAHHGLWFEDDKNYGEWIGNVRQFLHKLTGESGSPNPALHNGSQTPGDLAKIRAAFPIPHVPAYSTA